jgi:hypothetical protein
MDEADAVLDEIAEISKMFGSLISKTFLTIACYLMPIDLKEFQMIDLLLLDDAERTQNHDFSRRGWSALLDQADQHRQGRTVPAGVFKNLAEQPDSGYRRHRAGERGRAFERFRVRCDPRVSRGESRRLFAE